MSAESLNIVVFQEAGAWIAHCVELNICTQAPDLKTLSSRIGLTLQFELQESLRRGGSPFAGIGPSPAYIRDRWERTQSSGSARVTNCQVTTIDYTMALVHSREVFIRAAAPFDRSPTFAEYIAWAKGIGCILKYGYEARHGESPTRVITVEDPSSRSWAHIVEIKQTEILVSTQIGNLDTRLHLRSLFPLIDPDALCASYLS
jgi:hypothetical protein